MVFEYHLDDPVHLLCGLEFSDLVPAKEKKAYYKFVKLSLFFFFLFFSSTSYLHRNLRSVKCTLTVFSWRSNLHAWRRTSSKDSSDFTEHSELKLIFDTIKHQTFENMLKLISLINMNYSIWTRCSHFIVRMRKTCANVAKGFHRVVQRRERDLNTF